MSIQDQWMIHKPYEIHYATSEQVLKVIRNCKLVTNKVHELPQSGLIFKKHIWNNDKNDWPSSNFTTEM